MSKRRVVVTGMGMVSPIGHTVDESWQAAIAGQSGVGLNQSFDATDFGVKICASVKDFDISKFINPKEARRMDEFMHYGIAAGAQAMADRENCMTFQREKFSRPAQQRRSIDGRRFKR